MGQCTTGRLGVFNNNRKQCFAESRFHRSFPTFVNNNKVEQCSDNTRNILEFFGAGTGTGTTTLGNETRVRVQRKYINGSAAVSQRFVLDKSILAPRAYIHDGDVLEMGTPGMDWGFTGDVAGMRLQGTDYISVTAAPPQFDPVAYVASVDRLAAAGFQQLYLTHFGGITDVAAHLSRYRQRIQEVHEAVRCDHAAGLTPEQIRTHYQIREHALATAVGICEADWARLEQSNNSAMCADGVHLWVQKNSPV